MTTSVVKRFIAGAVCPACEVQDGVRMWQEQGVQHRDCVHCGYGDTLNAQGNVIPKELPTRVSSQAAVKPAPSSQALQFFPNPKLAKKTAE